MGGVAVVVAAVDDGRGKEGETAEAETVEGCQGSVVTDGCFPEKVEGAEACFVGDAE